MWNGHGHHDDTSRRLSIEMALAQHTGNSPIQPSHAPYGYDPQAEFLRRQMSSPQHMRRVNHADVHHHAPGAWGGHDFNGDYGAAGSGGGPSRYSPSPEHNGMAHSSHRQIHHAAKRKRQEDDSSSSDDDHEQLLSHSALAFGEPRGKPEAMAAKLASAARVQEKLEELEAEKEEDVMALPVEDLVEDEELGKKPKGKTTKESSKPKSKKKEAPAAAEESTPGQPPKKKKRKSPTPKKAKTQHSGAVPTMDDPVKPVSAVEYENLKSMMVQFCRVPLLAEFSRPVSLLHPELMSVYAKIVDHPVDLGTVCRKIRRKEYACLRDVRLEVWRIFSNCVRYHTHSTNKDAVPSFVSIALHLRDYFNDLWQEHMMASDPPSLSSGSKKSSGLEAQLKEAFSKRKTDRAKRMVVSGLSVMTGKSLERAAEALLVLLEKGGCVDQLDKTPVWGDDADDDDDDLDVIVDNLRRLQARIKEIVLTGDDYGLDELDRDVRKCYTEEVLENNPALKLRIANRMDRWIGKIVVPIHEATCRGVSQSSIWGCMAAAVWARESSKKPFWPALVLGIMAPEDQREEWHQALTSRNESRLPEKLKTQLASGKRKAEQAIKKQGVGQMEPQSFFLVEFLGTHEFIWVREADIVENFDPSEDPNQHMGTPGNKKKRSSRNSIASVIGSKMYAAAIEEGKWALEEFELQLQDVGGDGPEDEEEDDEEGYSYAVLSQSDDEADEELTEDDSKELDIEEMNELLATEGLIDFTSSGRKNAKKRAQMEKKRKADAEKKIKAEKLKKIKAEQSKKKRDERAKEKALKLEQKELEKKRKKRAREREKALKGSDKKRRISDSEGLNKSASGRRNLIAGKRERATAIVEGYLHRAMESNDYKTLCLGGGVMSIPAAMIDSTGLLGVALAYRAAAGELPMPEESGVQRSNVKLWDAVKVDSKKTSSERTECLQKQIELLEKEIERVKAATSTRRELAKEVRKEVVLVHEKMAQNDREARQNPLKKKKKAPGSSEKQGNKPKPHSGGRGKHKGGKGNPSSEVDPDESQEADTHTSHEHDEVVDVEVDAESVEESTAHGFDDNDDTSKEGSVDADMESEED